MGKTTRALLSIFAGGLVLSLGLAFSGVGVPKEEEQVAEQAPSAEEIQGIVEIILYYLSWCRFKRNRNT